MGPWTPEEDSALMRAIAVAEGDTKYRCVQSGLRVLGVWVCVRACVYACDCGVRPSLRGRTHD